MPTFDTDRIARSLQVAIDRLKASQRVTLAELRVLAQRGDYEPLVRLIDKKLKELSDDKPT